MRQNATLDQPDMVNGVYKPREKPADAETRPTNTDVKPLHVERDTRPEAQDKPITDANGKFPHERVIPQTDQFVQHNPVPTEGKHLHEDNDPKFNDLKDKAQPLATYSHAKPDDFAQEVYENPAFKPNNLPKDYGVVANPDYESAREYYELSANK